jgi:hypothetical protein
MPNKNIIIQILQMAIGITKFSLLVTFYLDWGFILVRHRRASTSGTLINQWLQTAGIKYWSENFFLPIQQRLLIHHGIVIRALIFRLIINLD